MPASTTRGYPYPVSGDSPDVATFQALATAINSDVVALFALLADTGWVNTTAGTAGITGTRLVRRIGNVVYGQINLTNGGSWPNSAFTFFNLPDTTWAPVITHRMSGGGPNQSTAGHINLIGTPGSTAVTGGATGSAGGVFNWSGPLWLVN